MTGNLKSDTIIRFFLKSEMIGKQWEGFMGRCGMMGIMGSLFTWESWEYDYMIAISRQSGKLDVI